MSAKYRKDLSKNVRRRMRYRGEISDEGWFASESQMLENEICSIQNKFNDMLDVARDWRAHANEVFTFARYAKEDFDNGTLEQKTIRNEGFGC